jgi:hypothetical protein
MFSDKTQQLSLLHLTYCSLLIWVQQPVSKRKSSMVHKLANAFETWLVLIISNFFTSQAAKQCFCIPAMANELIGCAK